LRASGPRSTHGKERLVEELAGVNPGKRPSPKRKEKKNFYFSTSASAPQRENGIDSDSSVSIGRKRRVESGERGASNWRAKWRRGDAQPLARAIAELRAREPASALRGRARRRDSACRPIVSSTRRPAAHEELLAEVVLEVAMRWLTADGVTLSSTAARAKLACRAHASNASSRCRAGPRSLTQRGAAGEGLPRDGLALRHAVHV
jgi:hypothetical protein